MRAYPLAVAAIIAAGLDCLRRGDLDGAGACLARAATLLRDEDAASASAREAA